MANALINDLQKNRLMEGLHTANQKETNQFRKSILLFAILGICLSFVIAIALLQANKAPVDTHNYILLHKQHPYFYLIEFFPFLYLILFVIIKKKNIKNSQKLHNQLKYQERHNNEIKKFVDKLIVEDFDYQYQKQEEEDVIGNSLQTLHDKFLQSKKDHETRALEDERHSWTAEGLAKFSEILHQNNNSLEELSYQFISNLVKYMNINQGGIFILKEENNVKYFEQTACFAYNRKKYCERRIEWGDGLIGTCALEKESIFLTKIPNNYLTITSGLGDANPKCILIVPLKYNDEIQGVIELASFTILQKYEVFFVEKLAESIGATLYNVKMNMNTRLLLEQSQLQTTELAQKEEELKQNIEEIRAAQEKVEFQSKEFETFTMAVDHTMMRAEFNSNGSLIYTNKNFFLKLGYKDSKEITGKPLSSFFDLRDHKTFVSLWHQITVNKTYFEGELKLTTRHHNDLWIMATILCIKNEMDAIVKILFLANDIHKQKLQNLEYEAQINALDRSSMKAQFLPSGKIRKYNTIFSKTMGFSSDEELEEKTIFSFVDEQANTSFKTIWDKALKDIPYEGQVKFVTAKGEFKWFQCTLTAVLDIYNETESIIFIGNEITKQKEMEIAAQEQALLLKQQEEKLRKSGEELTIKLEEVRKEMRLQFQEIEKIKLRNEKTLEGAHDAIITFNNKGNVDFFNTAAEGLWGYSRSAILNKNIAVLFSPNKEDNDPFVNELIDPKATKIVGIRKEIKILNSSGMEIPVLILLSEAKLDNEHTYTAFIQNIEVELF
jgi:PAS domain S-box-containing protein